MPAIARPILAALAARVSTMRYPALTAIAGGLFLLDLVVPDFIPLADEILLGLLTAALASWKKDRPRRTRSSEPPLGSGGR